MHILHRDYETFTIVDLREVGVWRYATHPSTDVWCSAYCVDDGPVKIWRRGDPVPEEWLEAVRNPEWVVAAFNDTFERLIEKHIMTPRYGWPEIPLERHRCLQASALAKALPPSLEAFADVLGLENRKDMLGAENMLDMSRPRAPRDGEDPAGVYWVDDPERKEQLERYCAQDVEVEREGEQRIGFLSPASQQLWELNERTNDYGFHVDRPLLEAGIKIARAVQRELNVELITLTGADVHTVGQNDRLIEWLDANGCAVDDLQRETLRRALTRKGLSPEVRRVLEVRLDGAHAAAAKLETMHVWRGDGDRIRGAYRCHGAHTGRDTSLGVQAHNFKKPKVEDLGAAVTAVATGDYMHMQRLYPQPLSVVGDCVRAMVRAAPGHQLFIGDFSGFESRGTADLSSQQSKIDQWAKFDRTQDPKDEPYTLLGRRLGFEGEQARAIGKVSDLAFGYQGGKGAWKKLAPKDDASTDDQIKSYQKAWKDAHPETVQYWYALDRAAITAVRRPGLVIACKRIAFKRDGDFLLMRLPSGRKLSYPHPRLITTDRDNIAVVHKVYKEKKWKDARFGYGAYGGIWLENAVQGYTCDIFKEAMLRLEAAGYRIALHVHDEVVCEVPNGFGSLEEFQRLLVTPPEWANMPIAANVREGERFAKIKPPLPHIDDAPPLAPELMDHTNVR
jgi:DNA polymerase bacteriophage-type